jgi:hypothetical protein
MAQIRGIQGLEVVIAHAAGVSGLFHGVLPVVGGRMSLPGYRSRGGRLKGGVTHASSRLRWDFEKDRKLLT